ncbi:lytic transglycosylase domain-containing protein [Treponema phagedenis]|uniref:Lytic transglycosylase domain-containing protein n=1 Tax=Treponema phagedenis TaxID=162 RepID=A0A0B7GQE9_TREPH|nr:lytic transglycosylase domain-containing protein [Treponema phagedenis]NVP23348.1 lytic transglycosylase domain-containing protein [Treponema phagedenis]QEJ95564.1 lytic transglycosylase domain-containing protein [Treponema phagedenis]QEJ98457.1 lytic transglycosylase domain-containing protein [Treponema phagedenis]QEK01417.1 lytic transglycosylase domain-containing protein [Treponema phagedenis]QEK03964.1 lytic transglycosylase domain-containing protein [Treponema phagedenis]
MKSLLNKQNLRNGKYHSAFLHKKFLFLCIVFCSSFFSCSTGSNIGKVFSALKDHDYSFFENPTKKTIKLVSRSGAGGLYFVGIHLKNAKNEEDAHKFFVQGTKGKAPFNLLCEEEAAITGTPEQRLLFIETALKTLSKQKTASKELIVKKEHLEDLQEELLFLLKRFDILKNSVKSIYIDTAFQAEKCEYFSEVLEAFPDLPEQFTDLVQARILLFYKDYRPAWQGFQKLLEDPVSVTEYLTDPVLSDIGRAALYGSQNAIEAAMLLRSISDTVKGASDLPKEQNLEFYTNFYAARLYTKAGSEGLKKALSLFQTAQQYAPTPADSDNTLWYYLDTLKKLSFNDFFTALTKTCGTWNDPNWFADLTDYTIVELVGRKQWQRLKILAEALENTALPDRQARIAYVLARSGMLSPEETTVAYQTAFQKDHYSFYYRILAANVLQIPLTDSLYKVRKQRNTHSFFSAEHSMEILRGYAVYELPDLIYPSIAKVYPNISVAEATELSHIQISQNRWADAIKIMSYALHSEDAVFDDEQLKLIYPRPWLDIVQKYAKQYGIAEYVLYALIRSESLFQPAVISHAGAIGLTQLMKPTAADIARKLKITEYDLTDPDTNIQFGTFFITDLIRRWDGAIMPALFSYNAGYARVRNWKKLQKDTPDDLFLETLAYGETRGYGRKILAAAVMYGYLYYNKTPAEIIAEIVGAHD